MANITITGRVTLAWWLKPYFYGLAVTSALTGRDPDWEKVTRMIVSVTAAPSGHK